MASGLNNIHADILNIPIPDRESEKNTLLEEVKRRGQVAFQRKSLLEAEVLYSRAIDINKNDHTLWSNRSASRHGMGKFDEALADANETVRLNPTWSKGYYRVAKAYEGLKAYDKACEAYEELLKIEPTNTAAKNELETIKSKGLDKISAATTATATATKATATISSTPKASANVTSSSAATANAEKKSTEMDIDEPLVEDVTTSAAEQASAFKGYKKTADGKTTTYFHRDLSEEEKKLLQGNKPKPLDATAAVDTSSKKNVAGSAWNEKGTFEEKDCTKWAKTKLETLLKEISVSNNTIAGIDEFTVTSLSDVDGDATISIVRGTKRWIFSFSLYIDWEVTINFPNKDESKTIKGKIYLSDVGSDSLGKDGSTDYDIKWGNRQDAGQYESDVSNFLNRDIKQKVFDKLLQFKNEYLALE